MSHLWTIFDQFLFAMDDLKWYRSCKVEDHSTRSDEGASRINRRQG